jgi:signal transduction histidine kinase
VPAIINFLRGPDLVFEFVHPKALVAMGGREVLGKALFVAVPEADRQAYCESIRQVFETGTPLIQNESPAWREVDGHRVETYWNSVYLPVRGPSGVIEGVMTFDVDVTETVLARRDTERVSRAKDEFLATMSHELRTPLNAILGWARILKSERRDAAKLERGLAIIERNAQTQARLVDDLMDMSRIISGKLLLSRRKVGVATVIHAAADVVRAAADAKGVLLLVELDPNLGAIVADPDRLQQIVWNLLSNAVRFTPAKGRITVTARRLGSIISVCVEDTGAGIAAEHLPHIFERFRQIDSSTTRRHGGLGLGLAIVRQLVEAHGGTVVAKSEGLGMGTSLTFTLPIRGVDAPDLAAETKTDWAETAGESPRSNSIGNVRALIVDDDSDSLELLRTVLEGEGAKVTTAQNARAALDAQGPFDIIISDIGMPEIDGYTFMRSVRSRDSGASVPAIALTAYARAEDTDQAIRAGYQEHLAKPVDASRLIDVVKRWATSAPK